MLPLSLVSGCTVNVENVNLLDIAGGTILISIVSILVYIGLSKVLPKFDTAKTAKDRIPMEYVPQSMKSRPPTALLPLSPSKIWVFKNNKRWGPYTPERIWKMARTVEAPG